MLAASRCRRHGEGGVPRMGAGALVRTSHLTIRSHSLTPIPLPTSYQTADIMRLCFYRLQAVSRSSPSCCGDYHQTTGAGLYYCSVVGTIQHLTGIIVSGSLLSHVPGPSSTISVRMDSPPTVCENGKPQEMPSENAVRRCPFLDGRLLFSESLNTVYGGGEMVWWLTLPTKCLLLRQAWKWLPLQPPRQRRLGEFGSDMLLAWRTFRAKLGAFYREEEQLFALVMPTPCTATPCLPETCRRLFTRACACRILPGQALPVLAALQIRHARRSVATT